MAYPANAIANFFIRKAKEEGRVDLNLMKLGKLIYIAHGYSLAYLKKPLIDESIQAWKYGPVIESVYHEFKYFGMQHITAFASPFELTENKTLIKRDYELKKRDASTLLLLNKVWDAYKAYTGIQLSNWSHMEGSPWHTAWNKDGGKYGYSHPIPDEYIKRYFEEHILRRMKKTMENKN